MADSHQPNGAGTALGLAPIKIANSLRDQAYAAIEDAIINSDIYGANGAIRLDERRLCEALGISRTPVREAMTRLEQKGLLRTLPRRGVYIVRKTRRELIEMSEVWAALESMAARLATLHASDAGIARLRHMFDEFVSTPPAAHIDEYSDANIAFHQAIIALSGSDLMKRMTENLFIHMRAIRRRTISEIDRAERSIIEHMQIIDALEQRDTERAERLVRLHSLGLAEHVRKYCDFLD